MQHEGLENVAGGVGVTVGPLKDFDPVERVRSIGAFTSGVNLHGIEI